MDFGLTPEVLRAGLIFFILLFASLILRAYAQAWLADRLGDPTPREEGRVTLYPVPHIDLFGTVILPLIFIFYLQPSITRAGIAFFLAWTNPVPINPANFANPRRDFLFTQFAGFGMSLLLGLAAAVGGGLLYGANPLTAELFLGLIAINAMLMFLDFLPIPPLPGGMLLRHLGFMSEETYLAVSRWGGFAVLIAFNIPVTRGIFQTIIALIQYPFLALFDIVR
ncbi:MAG TPA: site-2 protease family protein [Opitutaceae bacterium]|nr:site-2 protease family protein [Opitutaceae bacterium]